MELEIINKKLEIRSETYFLTILHFKNGLSIFLSESEPKLGTIGLSPPTTQFSTSTSIIHGMKNEHFVRIIGQRYSNITGKIVLVSLNIKNETVFDELLSLLDNIVKTTIKSENKE